MAAERDFEQSFQFPLGERYRHLVIPHSEIEGSAPNGPGLYSWHFRLPTVHTEKVAVFLSSLFHTARLSATVTANVRQRWTGELSTEANSFERGISPALPAAFFAIAYPIYIGISCDVRSRLTRHKDQLERYKTGPVATFDPDSHDDEQESRHFGQRLGHIFGSAGYYRTDHLFVKCVPWGGNGSGSPQGDELKQVMDELRAAEWTCNTLFHPVLGRR